MTIPECPDTRQTHPTYCLLDTTETNFTCVEPQAPSSNKLQRSVALPQCSPSFLQQLAAQRRPDTVFTLLPPTNCCAASPCHSVHPPSSNKLLRSVALTQCPPSFLQQNRPLTDPPINCYSYLLRPASALPLLMLKQKFYHILCYADRRRL